MKITDHEPPARPTGRAGGSAVLVVDDHQAVRLGVKALLAEEPGVEVVHSASSWREALAVAEEQAPDVAVVDFHLPDRDGLTLTRCLKAAPQPPRVLIFSAYADQRLELAALVAGADAVLNKHALGVELCDRVHRLIRGRDCELSISAEALTFASHQLDVDDRPILAMLVNGTAPADIAGALGVSEEWLDTRRWAILQRLKAPPRARRPGAFGLS